MRALIHVVESMFITERFPSALTGPRARRKKAGEKESEQEERGNKKKDGSRDLWIDFSPSNMLLQEIEITVFSALQL